MVLGCRGIGEMSESVYGHASAEEDGHRLSGVEIYEFDQNRRAADMWPGRLRAKLIRSLDAYLVRAAADLDERGEQLISRRTVLEKHREQLAEVEATLAKSRRRAGADRIDGKIEIELNALFDLHVMLQERDQEVARLKALVEAREGELARTAATLTKLQSSLQELFALRDARFATGDQQDA
jgi:hypothetical protein